MVGDGCWNATAYPFADKDAFYELSFLLTEKGYEVFVRDQIAFLFTTDKIRVNGRFFANFPHATNPETKLVEHPNLMEIQRCDEVAYVELQETL